MEDEVLPQSAIIFDHIIQTLLEDPRMYKIDLVVEPLRFHSHPRLEAGFHAQQCRLYRNHVVYMYIYINDAAPGMRINNWCVRRFIDDTEKPIELNIASATFFEDINNVLIDLILENI